MRSVLELALPAVISQIIMVVYNLADTYFVGRTDDPNKVAALTLCMPMMLLMTGMANLFGIGGSSMIARFLGRGDFNKAQRSSAFAIWCAVMLGFIYSLAVLVFCPTVLRLLGATDSTFKFAREYLTWVVIAGALPSILNALLAHLIRAEGNSRLASLGVSMGGVLNICLDPLFMFVLLPTGHETQGAAMATMLSNTAAAVLFAVHIIRHGKESVLTLDPRNVSLKDGIPSGVISIGIPSFLMTILSSFSNIVVNNLISAASSAAIAGMGIAKKINMLSFRVTTGITQGSLPLIVFNHSAGNYRRMKKSIAISAGISVGFAFICMLVSRTFGAQLVRLFIDNEETIAYRSSFIRIICFAMPLAAVSMSSMMMFQAAARKVESTALSVLRKGILDVPLMFILNRSLSVRGVAMATPIAEALGVCICAVLLIRFFRSLGSKPGHELPERKTIL